MGVRLIALTFAFCLLPGCVYDELLATHIMAGGTVQAQIDAGGMRSSTGLADNKDPLGLNGFSPYLTFGLVAGQDGAGVSAATTLTMPSVAVALNVTPLTVTRIEAHLDSTGCVGQNGIVNLRTDTALNISGDFDVTGMVSSADPTPCHLFGTLAGIPVDR